MELISYKILQGKYSGPMEIEIKLPKNLKLIYNEGIIGDGCYKTHNHFIGFVQQNDYLDIDFEEELYENNHPCINMSTFMFGDLIAIVLTDIKFISNHPDFYLSSDEIISDFNLHDYYIVRYTDDVYNKEKLDKLFKNEIVINNVEELIDKQGEPYKISKIQTLNGPYSVDLFTITTKNYYNPNIKDLSIELETNNDIERIITSFSMSKDNQPKIVVMKNANDLFESMKLEVLDNIR